MKKTIGSARVAVLLALAIFFTACSGNNNNNNPPEVTPVDPEPAAFAIIASNNDDLLGGPLARGRNGDFVLENDLIRVVVQRPGRRWLGIGTYGGNIIDASAKNSDGSFNPDHLEEFVLGVNIENTPNYTEVEISNDGSDGEPAVVCARGPDDLLDFINASSSIRGLGFQFPDSADDRDLPVEIETCYSLAEGDSYVTIDTVLSNSSVEPLVLYLTEYLNGSGQVEAFQPMVGFGEPQITPACPAEKTVSCDSAENGQCDQCNYLAFAGVDGAQGVSYGLIHEVSGTTSFSTSGVNVLILGQSVFDLLLGNGEPNFDIPAKGELAIRTYFAVGDGSVSSIADIRNQIFGIETGVLSGTVTSGGEPLLGAQVAVYQIINATTSPPTLFMAGHSPSNAAGEFRMSLPPGDYTVRANKEGYLFPAAQPGEITVAVNETSSVDIDFSQTGKLQVTVVDETGPGAAKLQLVGFDPSPQPSNNVQFGQAGIFGDTGADRLPFGVAMAEFIDRQGDSGTINIEPGDYQLVLSRGPRYSVFKKRITIVGGKTTTVQGEIVRIVESEGFVHGDFHVHSIDSPDAEVTREERVAVYLAEGMDFFTPSDHGVRVDFTGTLSAMGVGDLIGTASSSETTTFDYGHFNSWPVTVDPEQLGGGSLDWGRRAEPGMDFPEYSSYVLSPEEIIDGLHADPKDNLVQINHIASHFGSEGLSIDTGLTPPQSMADPVSRRLDPQLNNLFSDHFDALEVWIGTNGRDGIFKEFLQQNAGDWFNLINQGIVRVGIANSDSHDRRFTRISARNLIASDIKGGLELSQGAEQLATSVRNGKTIGTNAPFLLLDAQGSFEGQLRHAGLRFIDSTSLPVDVGSDVQLRVSVQTPSWAQVDTIEFYINNQPEKTTAQTEAARYSICPSVSIRMGDDGWSSVEVVVDEAVMGASRYEISATLTLPELTADTWIVAIARGSDGVSEPLFPVLPASLNRAGNTTVDELIDGNIGESGTPAFAFTNPLFVDVGGDGWVAPGVANAACE
ncbi:MAG: hypothetical protein ACI8QT_001341 [Halioglobus sp.]|jgi:hypothetical protein